MTEFKPAQWRGHWVELADFSKSVEVQNAYMLEMHSRILLCKQACREATGLLSTYAAYDKLVAVMTVWIYRVNEWHPPDLITYADEIAIIRTLRGDLVYLSQILRQEIAGRGGWSHGEEALIRTSGLIGIAEKLERNL